MLLTTVPGTLELANELLAISRWLAEDYPERTRMHTTPRERAAEHPRLTKGDPTIGPAGQPGLGLGPHACRGERGTRAAAGDGETVDRAVNDVISIQRTFGSSAAPEIAQIQTV